MKTLESHGDAELAGFLRRQAPSHLRVLTSHGLPEAYGSLNRNRNTPPSRASSFPAPEVAFPGWNSPCRREKLHLQEHADQSGGLASRRAHASQEDATMLQGQPITLEYKMSPGEVLKYRTQVDSEQSLKEEGQSEQTTRSVLEMMMEQKVLDVTGGLSKVDVTIQEGKILREGETLELPAVGQTIQITMKRNGAIVKTSVDSVLATGVPGSDPEGRREVTGDSKMDIPLWMGRVFPPARSPSP